MSAARTAHGCCDAVRRTDAENADLKRALSHGDAVHMLKGPDRGQSGHSTCANPLPVTPFHRSAKPALSLARPFALANISHRLLRQRPEDGEIVSFGRGNQHRHIRGGRRRVASDACLGDEVGKIASRPHSQDPCRAVPFDTKSMRNTAEAEGEISGVKQGLMEDPAKRRAYRMTGRA